MDFQGLKIGKTDILHLIEESLRVLPKPDGVGVHIRFDLADTAVRMDREGIGKVLVELGKNAIEAMPTGGDLTVVVGGDDERIVITIEDTGVGIPPESMDMLFTPFFSAKPIGEGTGLGLPSAYGMIKAHAGQISIESNADPQKGVTGTRIRITLPRWTLLKDPEKNLILHDE